MARMDDHYEQCNALLGNASGKTFLAMLEASFEEQKDLAIRVNDRDERERAVGAARHLESMIERIQRPPIERKKDS